MWERLKPADFLHHRQTNQVLLESFFSERKGRSIK